ncbi:unnamed protein product [Thelazia callipaeda]|uniref:J domain-containing protein n=1 Tax=Thelazia callipaeda TaxID=103827 RepID=A0A0N5CMA6_THECL|nr:unnamed protein product [Thelazia callipaeda]
MLCYLHAVLLLINCAVASAWTVEELAIYDLVDEIGQSFYEFYAIPKDASLSDIKKAYRRLSMEWHPDRNSNKEAETQFRKIAAIYEVLKSHNLRQKYDHVLENGLPDWKQPVFYYRRAKKLSWFEGMVVLVVIFSIGHYFMLWGAYIDKYLTLSSNRAKLRKKDIRQMKKAGNDAETLYEAEITEMLSDICPSWRNSLPVLIASLFYNIAISLPSFIQSYINTYYHKEIKSEKEIEKELPSRRYVTAPQPIYEYAVASDVKPVSSCVSNEDYGEQYISQNALHSGAWSSKELALLIRLSTDKYPAGTPNRWDLIAKVLNRATQNVTSMAGKLKHMNKDQYTKLIRDDQSSAFARSASHVTTLRPSNQCSDVNLTDFNISCEDNCGKISDFWSESDQRLFESALQQFPKGTVDRLEFYVRV